MLEGKPNEGKQIVASRGSKLIILDSGEQLDVSALDEYQRQELMASHARNIIDFRKKALEMGLDARVLNNMMGDMIDVSNKASQDGASVTITHTQDSSVGRTEVVIGNTDRAARGKISRSGRGDQDHVLKIVGIIVAAAIVIAFIIK